MKLKLFIFLFFGFIISGTGFSQDNFKKINEVNGAQVGDVVKDFSALDMFGKKFNLSEALKKGPIVLVFYRGQWCPFCNKHLSAIQDSLNLITDKGATVVAVSPEKPDYLQKTVEKTNATFTLLYDEDYKISSQFDVLFLPEGAARTKYNTFLGANLSEAHSDDSQQLPVPATFIISSERHIVWRHFDRNHKKRSTVADIVKNLPTKK
jgi:peroxiredoxin